MSVQAMAWVYDHERTTTGTTRLVLLSIANHADNQGRNSWPSIATMAGEANTSERSVQYAVRDLKAAGLIEVERNAGGMADTRHDRRPNRYSIPGLAAGPAVHSGAQPSAPRGPNGVQNGGKRGARSRADGVQPLAPEPSLEPSIENANPETQPVEIPEHGDGYDEGIAATRASLRDRATSAQVPKV